MTKDNNAIVSSRVRRPLPWGSAKKRTSAVSLLALLFLTAYLAASCAPPAGPAATPAPQAATGAALAPRPADTDWDKLVANARKEGTVVIYSSKRPPEREATAKAFAQQYGIELEWVQGRQPELVNKINTERRANLYLMDVILSSPDAITTELKPMNIFWPLDKLVVLPEVRDDSKWVGDRLPLFEDIAIKTTVVATEYRVINKNLVKPDEITSSLDLLQPKWKGKIVLSDPSISGGASDWFTNEVLVMGHGLDYMRKFAGQEPAISRDQRLIAEWLMHGKYSIMVGNSVSIPANLIQEAAPIAFVETKEPRVLSFAGNLILVSKDAPHPNASKLFLNWFLSREGSSVFSRAAEYPSMRKDVPTQGFLPNLVPRPGDIDPFTVAGYLAKKNEFYKVAAEIFGIK